MSLEENIKKSFEKVRTDIIEIKNQILRLAEEQKELRKLVEKAGKPAKAVKKKVKKR